MRTIERVRALFPVGATVRWVENTYAPIYNGDTRRIVAAGVGWRDCVTLAGPRAGESFHLQLPDLASDVLALTRRVVTWRLWRDADHTVTLEVLSDELGAPAACDGFCGRIGMGAPARACPHARTQSALAANDPQTRVGVLRPHREMVPYDVVVLPGWARCLDCGLHVMVEADGICSECRTEIPGEPENEVCATCSELPEP